MRGNKPLLNANKADEGKQDTSAATNRKKAERQWREQCAQTWSQDYKKQFDDDQNNASAHSSSEINDKCPIGSTRTEASP
jgi:hypothetical protein